jgi:hypothetical protein
VDDDDLGWEEIQTFSGSCTCDHDRDEHGWGHCDVEGCDCEAGWED